MIIGNLFYFLIKGRIILIFGLEYHNDLIILASICILNLGISSLEVSLFVDLINI